MATVSIIGAGGGDYTTIAAWESAIDNSTFTDDEIAEIRDLTADNSTVYFSGINTTASYKAIIRAESGYEADGTDAKGAQIDVKIILYESTNICNVEFDWIEFHTGGNGVEVRLGNASSLVIVTRCVFRDRSSHCVIATLCADISIYVGACLFRNGATYAYGVYCDDSDCTDIKVINCTFYDLYYGIGTDAGDYSTIKNCAVLGGTGSDYYGSPSNMSYCASSGDGTATGTGSIDTLRDDGTDFTDTSSDDFTLVSDGVLTGAGIAISGESWFPSTDLAGNAWASPPSIGCFEYVSGETNSSFDAGTETLTLTNYSSTIQSSVNQSVGLESLNLTGYNANTETGILISPSYEVLSITDYDSSLQSSVTVTIGYEDLPITDYEISTSSGVIISDNVFNLLLTDYDSSLQSSVSLSVGIESLTVTDYDTSTSSSATVSPNYESLILSDYPCTISSSIVFQGNLEQLIFTDYPCTISSSIVFQGNLEQLIFTDYDSSLQSSVSLSVGIESLTVTDCSGTTETSILISSNYESLSITDYAATFVLEGDVSFNADLETLTFTDYNATIQSSVSFLTNSENIILTNYSGVVSSSVTISPSYETLSVTDYDSSLQSSVSLSVGIESLTVTDYDATFLVELTYFADVESVVLTDYDISTSSTITISPSYEDLVLTFYDATFSTELTTGLTLPEIRQLIETGFETNWKSLTPIKYDNIVYHPDGNAYVELFIDKNIKESFSINGLQRNSGKITILFHVPLNSGTHYLSRMIDRAIYCLRGYAYEKIVFQDIFFRKGKLGYGFSNEQEEQYHIESLEANFIETVPHSTQVALAENSLFNDLRIDIESDFATNWTLTSVAYDNVDFKPDSDSWVSLEVIENFQKRIDSENLFRLFGVLNLNVYTKKGTVTDTPLSYCQEMIELFTTRQIGNVIIKDTEITRVGEVDGWLQYNVSCDFHSDRIYSVS